ncbi:hypothetical protein VTK56DRAFT_3833 [Thermocarpiscus australiensis]
MYRMYVRNIPYGKIPNLKKPNVLWHIQPCPFVAGTRELAASKEWSVCSKLFLRVPSFYDLGHRSFVPPVVGKPPWVGLIAAQRHHAYQALLCTAFLGSGSEAPTKHYTAPYFYSNQVWKLFSELAKRFGGRWPNLRCQCSTRPAVVPFPRVTDTYTKLRKTSLAEPIL